MTQVPVLVRCQSPCIVYMEPKHALFVNHHPKRTNDIHEIDQEKPLVVFIANFFTIPPKIPKHMVL